MFDKYFFFSTLCILSFLNTADSEAVKMSDIDDESEIFFSIKVSITLSLI